jgi:ribose 1,5-bisphosphate isomerase
VTTHIALQRVVERMQRDVIGGAADTAVEVIRSIFLIIKDSKANSPLELFNEIESAVIQILRVAHSMAPPLNALHRVMGTAEEQIGSCRDVEEMKSVLMETIDKFVLSCDSALERIANYGSELIAENDRIFMYSMSSSVWRILKRAREKGKNFSVSVTESRPANEGLWTVNKMLEYGIPVSVSIDACMIDLVPKSNLVFVGADAISSHGFVLNKVGTYPTALIAKEYKVPLYVAADTLKFDPITLIGLSWRIGPIHRHEVLNELEYEDKNVEVVGLHYDITPPEYITAIITEQGLIHPYACFTQMKQMKLSERLNEMLVLWSHGEL